MAKLHQPRLPSFKEEVDSIDSWLYRFEVYAKNSKWPESEWSAYLSAYLEGQALTLYHSIATTETLPYNDLKNALLHQFQCTADGFREKLRSIRPANNESFQAFMIKLQHTADRWIALTQTQHTYKALLDLVIQEQFLQSVSRELSTFLRERKPKTLEELVTLAEAYRLAHPEKSCARKTDQTIFASFAQTQQTYQPDTRRPISHPSEKTVRFSKPYTTSYSRSPPRNTPPQRRYLFEKPTYSKTDRPDFFTQRPTHKSTSPRTSPPPSPKLTRANKQSTHCYTCGGRGHFASQCPSPKFANTASTYVMSAASIHSLPIIEGLVNNKRVSVLRDTGANTAGIRRTLVLPEQYLHQTQTVSSFGGRLDIFPLATVTIDCPYYTGELTCCVLDNPAADLIMGNLPGVIPSVETLLNVSIPVPLPSLPPHTHNHTSIPTHNNIPITPHQHSNIQDTYNPDLLTPDLSHAPYTASVSTRAQTIKAKQDRQPLKHGIPDLNVTKATLIEAQQQDPSLKLYFQKAQSPTPILNPNTHTFTIHNDILYRKFMDKRGDTTLQIIVPHKLKPSVLTAAHDTPLSGHTGIRRTLQRVLSNFYWPSVRSDVRKYVTSCHTCQLTEPKGRIPPVPLRHMPTIKTPFHTVAIDIMGPFSPPSDNKFRYVLSIIDVSTRFPEAIPMAKIDSVSVAEELFTFFSRMGFPTQIISDNGSQFTSDMIKQFYHLLSITPIFSSPYHAQSNGKVERLHGTIKPMLKKVITNQPNQWHRYLPAVLFACREMINESTGFSPFYMLFGRKPRGLMDILADAWTDQNTPNQPEQHLFQYLIDLKNILTETQQLASTNNTKAVNKNKFHKDHKSKVRTFKPGDEVLLLLPADHNRLLLHWKGPYPVVSSHMDDYCININGTTKIYHANMLKKYTRRAQQAIIIPTLDTDTSTICTKTPFTNILPPDCVPQTTLPQPLVHAATAVLPASLEDDPLPVLTIPSQDQESIHNIQFHSSLSHNQQQEILNTFQPFHDILTADPGQYIGPVHHEINLISDHPVAKKQYPLPLKSIQIIQNEIKTMLDSGIIEPSSSPYSAPVVLVSKKDGSTRFCIDYRELNKITIPDAEPIPDIDFLFSNLSDKKYFTKFDLSKGYWQIPIKPEDRPKTAFQTSHGLFQFSRMAFGLMSAPATFARMMRTLDLEKHSAVNFFDDILIASKTWPEHLQHITGVLETLKQHGLTARPSKIFAGCPEVNFLGHVVGNGCLKPETTKIDKILLIPTPTSKKQVRSLLGLISYYRKFFPHFSTITAPISDLLKKKHTKFLWTPACVQALALIQQILSQSPILILPDLSKPFLLQTDASGVGIGAALFQQHQHTLHPVAFVSRKLMDREQRFSTIERECLAIVFAVQKLQKYLWNQHFTIQTDHNPLTYLKASNFQNSRLTRWALALQEFTYDIQPISGCNNVFADLLSRSQCDQEIP